tara:strand:- start:1258 stop:2697 length:1440 start_codon:yes stop_codon:yes gene_type:complete
MKLKNFILIFLIIFVPNAYGMEPSINSFKKNKLTNKKELISVASNELIDKPGFVCDPIKDKNFTICKNKSGNNVDIILKSDEEIIADYTINCLEGMVQGTINSKNDNIYKEIIEKTIINSCSMPKENLIIKSSLNMPDSTNEEAQLICTNKSVVFEQSNLDICKAHDNADNYLIRMKDNNNVLAQITGNCTNPDLQDKYLNNDSKYSKKIDFFNENVFPGTVDRICGIKSKENFEKNKNKFYSFNKFASKAYLEMSFSRFENYDYLGALKEVNRAININPTDPSSFDLRGMIKLEMGFIDEALENFNKAIYLDPKNKKYYLNRAKVYKNKNQYLELINDYNEIIKLDPFSHQIILERAILNIKIRNYESAFSDLNKFISNKKDNSKAYRNRGILYLNSGNFDLGCKDLDMAFKLGDQKTESLLSYLNSKASKTCNLNSIEKIEDSIISEDLNSKEYISVEELCEKNTYIKVDSKSSCFD